MPRVLYPISDWPQMLVSNLGTTRFKILQKWHRQTMPQGKVSSSKSNRFKQHLTSSKSRREGLIIPRSSVRVAPPPPNVSWTCGPLTRLPPRRVNTELITKFFAAVSGTSAARSCCDPLTGCRTRVYITARHRPCQFAVRRPHAIVPQVAVPLCVHDALVPSSWPVKRVNQNSCRGAHFDPRRAR
jgi:hypothetical protein